MRLVYGQKNSKRVVCKGASRAAAKQGAARARIELLHGLSAPPSPSMTHYAKRAQKQGWGSHADLAVGGLRWQQMVEGATDALTADMER
eukprot:CAMPEP_0202386556 /NCGR_PEP_ID=MMETSP1127-20130417/67160_1 /ASSEMBLY_ACC=CAM_ASM_000462 /TAXON_ID=3047 /ORGANISM="Dunaliella tertiolecta, Strain CCMP1320" /LENGTH=88 /DNA_ID=CAMNT_0048987167 /DNA_START=203 /DNA_END=466 /DNA_ORIENTATION=+